MPLALPKDVRHWLVVDVEATCSRDGSVPRLERETIEWAAVRMDAETGELTSSFHTRVRPVRHPILTPYCIQLTSLRQSDVDAAPEFPLARKTFGDWNRCHPPARFASWGTFDSIQLERDCRFHQLKTIAWMEPLDIRKAFARSFGTRSLGLRQAFAHLAQTPGGRAHNAPDDARNAARLLRQILKEEAADAPRP